MLWRWKNFAAGKPEMDNNGDVLVVGAGVAGVVAAARLAALGHKATVVYKSTGSSSYSSGAVDVADSKIDEVPGITDPFERGIGWLKAAQNVRQKNTDHPYAQCYESLEVLPRALALLIDLSKDVCLQEREDGHNYILATQLGTVKRSALVQKSLCCDLATLSSNSCVGIVEISGLLGFSAKPVADMLRWVGQMRAGPSFQVLPIYMTLMPKFSVGWRSQIEAAYAFDDVQMRNEFVQSLRQSLANLPVKPDQLLFPAVMGFQNPIGMLEMIEKASLVPSHELLSLPFSVPGMRLSNAFFSGLRRCGVNCINGKIIDYVLQNKKLISILVQNNEGNQIEFRPKAVVLATGRHLAGGIVNDGIMKDAVFNLPAWINQGPVFDKFPLDMTQSSVEAPHELFRLGLACDQQQRPLDQFGELFASNLYAAGSVMKGYDPAKEVTGIGVAALLGFRAAGFVSTNVLLSHKF
jgi:glycerol-3-phosphate dehydrogenase subunit B